METFLIGEIYDDGANKIMLKFGFDPRQSTDGRNLLGVNYARMNPVHARMELPATEHMRAVGRLFTCRIAS